MNEVHINSEAYDVYKELTKENAPKGATFDAVELAFLLAVKSIKKMQIKS